MNFKAIFGLVRDAFKDWSANKASRLGAALAYYTIFSIGPLLLVLIGIAGIVFGQAAAQGQVESALSGVLGSGASAVQEMIKSSSKGGSGIIATVIGLVTLLLGAAGIFGQLQDALNTIFGVVFKPAGIVGMLKARLLTFLMVLGVALLLLASLAASALLSVLAGYVSGILPGGAIVWQIVNYLVTAAIIVLAFALIYKLLPDARIAWKSTFVGAVVTTVLFILGQILLSIYFGFSNPGSAFGAAGSLVVVLVWIYYTAQIIFFGAEITKVYANRYGTGLQPKPGAEWLSEELRADQGMGPEAQPARKPRKREGAPHFAGSPWFK